MGILGGKRVFHGRVEIFIEILQDGGPLLFSFGYLIELLFNAGSKVIVEDVGEIFHQEIIDYRTCIGRHQFGFFGSCNFRLRNVRNLLSCNESML